MTLFRLPFFLLNFSELGHSCGARGAVCPTRADGLVRIGILDNLRKQWGGFALAWSIHHVNLEAKDVRRAVAFYRDILGMELRDWVFPDSRGYLPGDPDKLALLTDGREGHTGLHLIAPDPEFANKNNMEHNPSLGGHVAFQVSDLDGVIARLQAAGIAHSVTGEFAIPGLRHVYVEDTEGNLLEINGFTGEGPQPAPVRHVVLCKIRADVPDADIQELWSDLKGLRALVPQMGPVSAGLNSSPEALAQGYSHGFTVDFPSAAARDIYLDHPAHKAVGARLVAMCEDGLDGLCVVDL